MKVISRIKSEKTKIIENIITEKNIMKEVDHLFVMKLKYSFHSRKNLYLVMKYMKGADLYFHLKEAKKFDIDAVRFFAIEILCGLEYLHINKKIIYRDMKLQNILIDEKGHIKISDFGLSKINCFVGKTICGTFEFMAPEIFLNKEYTSKVDYWTYVI